MLFVISKYLVNRVHFKARITFPPSALRTLFVSLSYAPMTQIEHYQHNDHHNAQHWPEIERNIFEKRNIFDAVTLNLPCYNEISIPIDTLSSPPHNPWLPYGAAAFIPICVILWIIPMHVGLSKKSFGPVRSGRASQTTTKHHEHRNTSEWNQKNPLVTLAGVHQRWPSIIQCVSYRRTNHFELILWFAFSLQQLHVSVCVYLCL